MSEHVRDVVLKCAQSLNVINVLRRHGMNDQALQTVYRSVVLAKLLNASSAWWGFMTIDDRHRIETVVESGLIYTRLMGQRQLNSSRTTTTHCSVTL